ncbi:MAG: type II restriction endonuclease [Holophagales bacterium]|jgi:type II restriction enzyme|nr:type II restriction endonuclease [Holophagales bacterium]
MISPCCERAIEDALNYKNALLKFITPNNVGITGSHECGFLLPHSGEIWKMYTPHPPDKGKNSKHQVSIIWQDGRETQSVITGYFKEKNEYRLTSFGRDFPFLTADVVGDLLVLIATSQNKFMAYVLDYDEDIEEIQSALGVEAFERWGGVYRDGIPHITETLETEANCIDRKIREFSVKCTSFPKGEVFSETVRAILLECQKEFPTLSPDKALMCAYQTEYQLFQYVERQVCQNDVAGRLFRDIDDFLKTAASIMNRRKTRAGRSFENHIGYLLKEVGIPHKMRPSLGIDGKPDIIIPDENAYFNETFPKEKLFVLGLKTTCKDRWRQVLNEAPRHKAKHIITLQQGISKNQLAEMNTAGISLVVPEILHTKYPKDHAINLLTVEEFIKTVKDQLGL